MVEIKRRSLLSDKTAEDSNPLSLGIGYGDVRMQSTYREPGHCVSFNDNPK